MQELKMQELKNLFFYTFGILPLQNYNVVGDGITDNRLNIQQAIYDAIEVGARYIFVPKGNYYYSNKLFKANEIIFIGNSVDVQIKDVEIMQFPGFAPIGGVIQYAGQSIPNGYLECNGQSVTTENYMNLYIALNGKQEEFPPEFNVPNLTTGNTTKYIIRAR